MQDSVPISTDRSFGARDQRAQETEDKRTVYTFKRWEERRVKRREDVRITIENDAHILSIIEYRVNWDLST